jgi:hypothetical protein
MARAAVVSDMTIARSPFLSAVPIWKVAFHEKSWRSKL